MSKSIQERVKHLETVVKSCCNRFFKLKEQVDTLETTVEDMTTDISMALDLKADKVLPAYSMRVNNTGVPAEAQSLYFRQSSLAVYTGTVTWTGGTAPSGATSHTYNWIRIGNLVTLNITLFYVTVGSGNSSVVLPFLSDFPTPIKPTALSGASNVLYNGVGEFRVSATSTAVANMTTVVLRSNSDNTGFEINVVQLLPTINAKIVKLTIQYFTA